MRTSTAILPVLAAVLALPATAQRPALASSVFDWMPKNRQTGGGWQSAYSWDDGMSENSIGVVPNGGDLIWMTQFFTGDRGITSDTITDVSVAVGSPAFPGGINPGDPIRIYVWEDTDDDGDPRTGLVCLVEQAEVVASPYTDIKVVYALDNPVVVSGSFFVGAGVNHAANEFPDAFDQNEAGKDPSCRFRTWLAGKGPGPDTTCDLANATFFDSADAFGLLGLNLVDGFGTGGGIINYCTAKSGLVCGVPAMSFTGVPQAGASSGFDISGSPARGNRSGLVLYSCSGRASFPFQGGILCVNPAPLRRSSVVNSGGTNGACDGVFSLDWNAFASGNAGGNPDACIQMAGQQVNTQFWGRDSVATGSFLTDGLEFFM